MGDKDKNIDRVILLVGVSLRNLSGLTTSQVEAIARRNNHNVRVNFMLGLDAELKKTLGPDKGLVWPTAENWRTGRFFKVDPDDLPDIEPAQTVPVVGNNEEGDDDTEDISDDAPTIEELQQIEEEIEKGEVTPDFSLLLEEIEKIVDEQIIPEPPKEILEELDTEEEDIVMNEAEAVEKDGSEDKVWLEIGTITREKFERAGIMNTSQLLELAKTEDGMEQVRNAVAPSGSKIGQALTAVDRVLKKHDLPTLPARNVEEERKLREKEERKRQISPEVAELMRQETFAEKVARKVVDLLDPKLSGIVIEPNEKILSALKARETFDAKALEVIHRIKNIIGEDGVIALLDAQFVALKRAEAGRASEVFK